MDILKNLVVQVNEHSKKLKNELEIMNIAVVVQDIDDGCKIMKVDIDKSKFEFATLLQFINLIQSIKKFKLFKIDSIYILNIDEY